MRKKMNRATEVLPRESGMLRRSLGLEGPVSALGRCRTRVRAFLWASRRGGSRWVDGTGIQQGKGEEGRAGESTAITQQFAVASSSPRGRRETQCPHAIPLSD